MEENPTSDEEKGIEENKEVVNEENAESSDSDIKEDKINEEETSVSDERGAGEPLKEEVKEEPQVVNNPNQPSEQTEKSEPVSEQPETQIEVVEEKEEPVKEVPKEETPVVPKSKEGKKEGSWMPMIIIMGVSLVIAFAWDKVDFIRNSVHTVLDPSAGALLAWNPTMGMLIIVFCIGLLTTFIQKYATDQAALRELKKEQKILQEEMKKYKDHPEKVAELSKKQLQFIPKTFKLTSRAVMFTGIPFILFFRWFTDVFTAMEVATGVPVRFLGFLSWFWFYLIFTMVFSTILRKALKVV